MYEYTIKLIKFFYSQTATKSCKGVSKNLSDMSKELDNIAQATSVGDLPEKLQEAEEAKAEVESQLLERVGLFDSLH